MRKPWYTYLYVKSPVVKIALGILAVLLALVIILFAGVLEEPRMEVQAANWNGRSIEKGADIFANNCVSCHGPNGEGGAGPALNSKYFFTQRLADIGYAGTLHDYVELTVAAGRPSKIGGQWAVVMPTWSSQFGGPLREDQVLNVTNYVMNWEASALQQSDEEDPWIAFQDTPSQAAEAATGDGDAGTTGDAVITAGEGADDSAGPRPPAELFVSMGCSACHMLDEPQTDSNRGLIAPNLSNLHETAGTRVEGQDAVTYVHTSIAAPNEYINEGYLPNIMPPNFEERMTPEEIDGFVQWLLDPNRGE